MSNAGLQRDLDRLGRAAQKLLRLRSVGSSGSLQRSGAPSNGEIVIEQIDTGEPRMIVQCGERPRRRFWVAGIFEER